MINIIEENFATLCICALRYCHGRRTYMPSLVQDIVKRYLSELEDRDLRVMLDDCDFQERMELYGDPCDKTDWLKWRADVEKEIERRNRER